uniref:Uncharacterized protein n=1 Tax=Magallana gigas TaxID=29159 RepID=A0A8W8KMP9_MAGGI
MRRNQQVSFHKNETSAMIRACVVFGVCIVTVFSDEYQGSDSYIPDGNGGGHIGGGQIGGGLGLGSIIGGGSCLLMKGFENVVKLNLI